MGSSLYGKNLFLQEQILSFDPIARKVKIVCNFGLSEFNKVKS